MEITAKITKTSVHTKEKLTSSSNTMRRSRHTEISSHG